MVTQDLDGVECQNPQCKTEHPLFLSATCHIGEGTDISYSAGVLTISCHKCDLVICRVKVASAQVQ